MSDLEMTTLCAEAMGYSIATLSPKHKGPHILCFKEGASVDYCPLEDDAQAMALVKRFDLCIGATNAVGERSAFTYNLSVLNADLNRAIVECVAKM